MFQISKFEFNPIQVNCYLIWEAETMQCAIVDPGMSSTEEYATLTQYIEQNGLKPVYILLTHAHVDHVAGLREVCKRYHLPVTMHKDGTHLLRQVEAYASMMGFNVNNMDDLEVQEIHDNDVISIENGKWKIENLANASNNSQPSTLNSQFKIECRYVPGHCPGSICYVLHDEQTVLTGDAIFHFSIGRTDLPGGDFDLLVDKLKSRILTLPEHYRILPGHGIPSEVWKEKKYNPFLK